MIPSWPAGRTTSRSPSGSPGAGPAREASPRRWPALAGRGRRVAAVAAVVVAAAGGVAACGSSNSDHGGKADATAACQALARSQSDVKRPSLSLGYRLTGAGNLGVAAAGEDPGKYANLSAPMKQVQTDVNLNQTSRTAGDVKAALAACKTDGLPN